MRPLLLTLACLTACGARQATFDATVTFAIEGAQGAGATTTEATTVFVALRKPGRTPIVDADPDGAADGERYGRHRFPPYCTAEAVAGYFDGLLANAGWTADDYRVDGNRLRLFGVRQAIAGATGSQVRARVDRR